MKTLLKKCKNIEYCVTDNILVSDSTSFNSASFLSKNKTSEVFLERNGRMAF